MPATQGAKLKGNPAHKRIGNARHIACRAACWARGKKRKDERVKANHAAHTANRRLHANGELTAWELAKAQRRLRRSNDPVVQKRRHAFLEEA